MNPAGLFVNTVTIKVPTLSTQTDGSTTRTYADTEAVCSLQPMSASEAVRLGRDAASVLARAYFPAGTSLTVDSEIVDAASVRWRVIGRGRDTGGRSQFITVDLERQV